MKFIRIALLVALSFFLNPSFATTVSPDWPCGDGFVLMDTGIAIGQAEQVFDSDTLRQSKVTDNYDLVSTTADLSLKPEVGWRR